MDKVCYNENNHKKLVLNDFIGKYVANEPMDCVKLKQELKN